MPSVPSTSLMPSVLRHILTDSYIYRVMVSDVHSSQCGSNKTYTFFALGSTSKRSTLYLRVAIELGDIPSLDVECIGSLPAIDTGVWVSYASLDHIGMRGTWLEQRRSTVTWRLMAFTRSSVLKSAETFHQTSTPHGESSLAIHEGTCIWEYEAQSEQKFCHPFMKC